MGGNTINRIDIMGDEKWIGKSSRKDEHEEI